MLVSLESVIKPTFLIPKFVSSKLLKESTMPDKVCTIPMSVSSESTTTASWSVDVVCRDCRVVVSQSWVISMSKLEQVLTSNFGYTLDLGAETEHIFAHSIGPALTLDDLQVGLKVSGARAALGSEVRTKLGLSPSRFDPFPQSFTTLMHSAVLCKSRLPRRVDTEFIPFVFGAIADRPSRNFTPTIPSIFNSVPRSTCLVRMSAGCSAPNILCSFAWPELNFS